MNHLVTKFCFLSLALLLLSCEVFKKKEETIISEDFLCDYLAQRRIDVRLDKIPTIEEFKNGGKPHRLNKLPDTLKPLKIYIWNNEIEPIQPLTSVFENLDNVSRHSIKKSLQTSKCEGFEVLTENSLAKFTSRSQNTDLGVLIQTSHIYYDKNLTKGVVFLRVTKSPLNSTESMIILKKLGNTWVVDKTIGISIS